MRKYLIPFLFAASLAYAALCIHFSAQTPLGWDEIDYVNASREGLAANHLEQNSLSLLQFYKLGSLKRGGDQQAVAAYASSLPDEKKDPFQLRHFHPPLPNYFWMAWDKFTQTSSGWHYSMLFVLLLSGLAFYFTLPRGSRSFGLITGAVFFSATAAANAFTTLNYHVFHLPACIFYAAVFFRHLENPVRRNGILLGIAAALLLLTLEMGLAVLALSALSVLLLRRTREYFRRQTIFSLLAGFLLTIALCWFGFFLKGGSFKALLMYVYRVIAAGNEEYSQVSAGRFWLQLCRENIFLVGWCFAGTAVTVYAIWRKLVPRTYLAPLLLAVGYAIIMSPFAIAQTYIIPALGLLCFQFALVLGALVRNRTAEKYIQALPYFLVLPLAFAFAGRNFQTLSTEAAFAKRDLEGDLAQIRSLTDSSATILATGAHVPAFYLPEYHFSDAQRNSFSDTTLFARKNYTYVSLEDSLRQKRYGAILVQKLLDYPEPSLKHIESLGYRRYTLNDFEFFLPEAR